MKILYGKETGVIMSFNPSETKFALAILRGIQKVVNASFIDEAIAEIEKDLRPKLTLVSHFHYCQKCMMEIDDREGDNFVHYTSDDKDYWTHNTCPPLKPNRPV